RNNPAELAPSLSRMETPRGGRREVSPAWDGPAGRLARSDRPTGQRLARRPSPPGGSNVNAAYLMLTTAWLAGQNPAPPAAAPAAPAPAPVAAAPVVSTSMGACNGGYAGYGAYGGCGGGCGAAASDCGCE